MCVVVCMNVRCTRVKRMHFTSRYAVCIAIGLILAVSCVRCGGVAAEMSFSVETVSAVMASALPQWPMSMMMMMMPMSSQKPPLLSFLEKNDLEEIYEKLRGAGFESVGDVALATSEELMSEVDIGSGAVRRRLIARAKEVRFT